MVALTIGMATYNDFNGVYFTLQSLRLYQDLRDTELLVVDNYGCPATKQLVEGWVHGARYVLATEVRGTAAAKDRVFREARGEAVLCCDSHVLFAPGAIRRLKEYYREHPECPDPLQGPLVYDDLQTISTHFDPGWRARSWGPILGCYLLVPDSMSGSPCTCSSTGSWCGSTPSVRSTSHAGIRI